MNLNSIIKVTITRNTSQPSRTGFGTPIILSADPELNAANPWGAEKVRTYTSLSSVASDFPLSTDNTYTNRNVYEMAAAIFGQNPSPSQVKIGRLSTSPVAQTIAFTVTDTAEGASVGFTINGKPAYATVAQGDNADAVAVKLDTAIDAAVDVAPTTPTGVSTVSDTVTLTGDNAGERFRFTDLRGVTVNDNTAAGGIAADLAAIVAQDNDFYAVVIDGISAAEIEAVSDYVNDNSDNPKIFAYRTLDSDVATTATDDIMSTLKGKNALRSMGWYTRAGDYVDCAILGSCLPELPGGVNWGWRNLLNVVGDTTLTDTERNRLLDLDTGKLGNVYTPIAGVTVSQWGITAGKEWIDTVRGSDWLAARISERVAAVLINSDKIPMTDAGLAVLRAEILSQLQQGVTNGFLAATPEPTCEVPLAVDIPDADKQARHLKGVVFRGVIAGAINQAEFVGELSL